VSCLNEIMPSPSRKGKERGEMTEEERIEAERKQRSFERSLAGPSVGKAGEAVAFNVLTP
jgi:hypothetical protein